ncbi:MAG TPA: DUF2523 family protein [Burkholderiales bacterium]|nr:DUF2523 family protein [Burkholderiales bacterium]
MPTFAALLMGLAWPMVARVLVSLGLGVITYTGASALLSAAVSAAKASFSGMTPDVLQLLALAGFFQSCAIMVGALAGGLALMTFKRLGLISGT